MQSIRIDGLSDKLLTSNGSPDIIYVMGSSQWRGSRLGSLITGILGRRGLVTITFPGYKQVIDNTVWLSKFWNFSVRVAQFYDRRAYFSSFWKMIKLF